MFIGLVAANGRNLQNRKVLWDRPQDSTTDIKGTNRWQRGLFSDLVGRYFNHEFGAIKVKDNERTIGGKIAAKDGKGKNWRMEPRLWRQKHSAKLPTRQSYRAAMRDLNVSTL